MSDLVAVAAIVSVTQLIQFFVARRDTKKLSGQMTEVVHATNSIVAQGKIDSESIGHAKGVEDERNRQA